jgi:hypothetical protein
MSEEPAETTGAAATNDTSVAREDRKEHPRQGAHQGHLSESASSAAQPTAKEDLEEKSYELGFEISKSYPLSR